MYSTKSRKEWDIHYLYLSTGDRRISSINSTLAKTNIASENGPSQEESNLPTINFQGLYT